jgi:hypothetical protein
MPFLTVCTNHRDCTGVAPCPHCAAQTPLASSPGRVIQGTRTTYLRIDMELPREIDEVRLNGVVYRRVSEPEPATHEPRGAFPAPRIESDND